MELLTQWILPAWRELQSRCPVKLCSITSERHGKTMTDFMNELLDEVGDQREHPLTGLLDAVTAFVRDYEDEHCVLQKGKPGAVLRFLMEQNDLDPDDLRAFFDSYEEVIEALAGAAPITTDQARALGKQFGVPASMFLAR
jgi:antitoxin component HigA of HigAB toxin-antitoxin module